MDDEQPAAEGGGPARAAEAAAAAPPRAPPVKEAVIPPHYTVLDAALEALVLSRLPAQSGGAGSKKRRREELKATRSCYDWVNTGACSYGEACRYSHDPAVKPEQGNRSRNTLRALAQEREHLFVTGTVAGSSSSSSSSSAAGGGGGEAPAPGAPAPSAASAAVSTFLASTTLEDRLVGPQVTPLSALARYYTRLYSPGTGAGASSPGWDTYVHLQANKCCVVGLAAAHPLLLHAARCSPIVALALAPALAAPGAMSLSGKRKKGAVWVEAETVLATATTADGRQWPLRAGMRGSLVEFNARLLARPGLLTLRPATQGHLAVVLTDLKRVLEVTRGLMGEGDYAQLCAARGLPVG